MHDAGCHTLKYPQADPTTGKIMAVDANGAATVDEAATALWVTHKNMGR